MLRRLDFRIPRDARKVIPGKFREWAGLVGRVGFLCQPRRKLRQRFILRRVVSSGPGVKSSF
jgi:hypothetical protein